MVYLYLAMRRNKDNVPEYHGQKESREICHGDEAQTIARLKGNITSPGVWRIYRSVNLRDVKKAELELIKTLVDRMAFPASVTDAPVASLWKTILMQPHNKAERKFLIDVDDEAMLLPVLSMPIIQVEQKVKTPNGYHLITQPFNVNLIQDMQDVSVQKDGFLFIERFEVKDARLAK